MTIIPSSSSVFSSTLGAWGLTSLYAMKTVGLGRMSLVGGTSDSSKVGAAPGALEPGLHGRLEAAPVRVGGLGIGPLGFVALHCTRFYLA